MAAGAHDTLRTSLGQLLGSHVWQYSGPVPHHSSHTPSSWKLSLVFPSLHSSELPLKGPKELVRSGKSVALASAPRDTI